MEEELRKIAREHLFIQTLEVRGRDSLDFHDVGVMGVKKALEAAYKLGQASVKKPKKKVAKNDNATSNIKGC